MTQTTKAMTLWLERRRIRGLLKFDVPFATVSALRGMIVMDLQRTAMLGLARPPRPVRSRQDPESVPSFSSMAVAPEPRK
ncbi:hypothetical protein [Hyphomicrobium sp. 2TAF46]|uniref:hypothetical protein n=1 Tax=Hyphomicrobium sp. 2TAF46 TaxID=3233019 RepID=UPI003F910745